MASDYVFLSPHHDDAVLSCGGLLAALGAENVTPVVVNVFSDMVTEAVLSRYASVVRDTDTWDPSNAAKLISVEDELACAIVGARRVELSMPAPIRSPAYSDWNSIIGEIPAVDLDLDQRIFNVLTQSGELAADPIVFCPLSIGEHVDHRIVHRVGRTLLSQGTRVVFYEDFPYCINAAALSKFAFPEDCEPLTLSIGKFADAKFFAISCYRSELGGLFPEGICSALGKNAHRLGIAGMGERYWSPLGKTGSWPDLLTKMTIKPVE